MVIVLSLLTAVTYGAADFAGGAATKRARLMDVIGISHLIGLIGITVFAVFAADAFTARDFLLGAGGGFFGLIGLAFLYRRLASGPMVVVAPLTAITSALVPAAWGVGSGESVTITVGVGLLVALVAIGLISVSPNNEPDTEGGGDTPLPQVIAESLLAGVGFGTMFIFIDAAESATAPWPIVGARLLSTTLLAVIILSRANVERPFQSSDGGRLPLGLIAAAGILDCGANAFFLYASNVGDLTTAAVLSSLYPAATVILARLILDERMSRTQAVGFGLAVLATALISIG